MVKMDISGILKMDVEALYSAFNKEDFKKANMFANRIMSNAIIGEDPKFTIIGFFLKDISLIYLELKAKKETTMFSTAKSFGEVYIKNINLDGNLDEYWQRYHELCNSIRKYLQNDHEQSYTDSIEFSHEYFRWLLEILRNEKEILLIDDNQFFRGIYSEMNRIFRVHGGGIEETYALSLIRILQFYDEYTASYRNAKNDIIKSSFFPYVDSTVEILSKKVVDQKAVSILLHKIIKDWRLSFIRFTERAQFVPVKEEALPISEETKKKLADIIAKSLEEEVK
jgi:hypothetical protein